MALRYYANAPATSLASGITNSALSLTVVSATGFPVSYPYTLIIDRGEVTEEIVEVTAGSGDTLTVTRAADDSTAFQHSAGATVEHGISARDIREANTHVNSESGVHGVIGDVVGTTDAQTLSDKDLSDESNSFPASLATLTGTQALENKTLDNPTITDPEFTGTPFGIPPVGVVLEYAGSSAPAGYLMADGSAVSRTTYADLFAVIGEDFGSGNGTTTFNLPDRRDQVAVGASGTKPLASTGGSDTATLTEANLPPHSHTINHDHPAVGTSSDAHTHTIGFEYFPNTETKVDGSLRVTDINNQTGGTGTNANGTTSSDAHSHTVDLPSFSGSSGSTGSGTAFDVTNPYVAMNYIIKY